MNVINNKTMNVIPKYRQMQKIQDMEYEKVVKKESLNKFLEKYIRLKEQLMFEEKY